jgi:GntR family transcriptional regulator, arabinose operon transcriptional repressor
MNWNMIAVAATGITQLAEQFGVSRNAVRQALHNLAHEGWVETMKGIGTFCRSPVAKSRLHNTIGFVCFFSGSYIFPDILRGCDNVLYRRGFHVLLNQSEYDAGKERAILEGLRNRGVDGVLLEPIYDASGSPNGALLTELERAGIPVVLIDGCLDGAGFSCVSLDDAAGGYLAAKYLWERGHRRIGGFFQNDYVVKVARMSGVRRFLREKDIEPPPDWFTGFKGQGPGSGAEEAAASLLSAARAAGAAKAAGAASTAGAGQELPTGIVCGNDEEALVLIRTAQSIGLRVPEDLSIVGFDNSNIAQLDQVALTTVDHPSFLMGEMATNILLERVFHPERSFVTRTVITPTLVERRSVAAPRRDAAPQNRG